MTDLNRMKHLAGLTMESARGLLKEYGDMDGEITKDSVKKSALELLVDIAKTSKQYKGEVTDDQVHYLGSLVHDFDIAGIETEKYSEIEKLFRTMAATERAEMSMIQPAYAQAKTLDEDATAESSDMQDGEEDDASKTWKTPYGKVTANWSFYAGEYSDFDAEDEQLQDILILMSDETETIDHDNVVDVIKAAMKKRKGMGESAVEEAVGDSAECFYDLQDEYCGEQCPSMPHKTLIDELVRYLSGDQLQDFCDDFRRHHMDGMEESKDLNELKKLAGLGNNVYDPGAGHQGPGGYVDRDTRALQGDNQTPIDLDAIIKRGKENQIIGKYRPPGSSQKELDDILRRRAKELEPDPRIGRDIENDDIKSRIDRIKNSQLNQFGKLK
jgi:uncharacterized protein (DUF2147 family)